MNQIKTGAILSYLSIILTILITLIYTPILIRLLGQSEYGLYAMIGSISAYLSILDLGLGNAIVRYTARNRVVGDKVQEANLNGLFMCLYSVISIITIIIGFFIFSSVENIFGNSLTNSEIGKAKIMVIILIFNYALSFPLAIFGSIMQAYERFVVSKFINILRSILIPLFVIPFLLLGFNSVAVVLITSIVNILCLLFNVFYCYKNLDIKFRIESFNFPLIKEIIGYSFFIFLGIIVDQINWNTGQIVLGIVSGTTAVGVFAIAIQFVKLYLMFSTSLSGLFLPKVSMMVAKNSSNKELTSIMIKVGRIQYEILLLILVGFILFGFDFIALWAGEIYTDAYYMTLIILIPLTVPFIQNIGLTILQAKNLQGFRSIVLIVIAIINVLISVPLSKLYGGIGVAIGTGSSYLIGNAIIMNIYYKKRIGINILSFWQNILKLTIVGIISLSIGMLINWRITEDNWEFLIIKIVLFSLTYVILMWIFGFDKYEKQIINSIILKLKNLVLIRRKKIKKVYRSE